MFATPRLLEGPSRTGPELRVGVGVAVVDVGVGVAEGVIDGVALGVADGVADGVAVGVAEGRRGAAEVGAVDGISGRVIGCANPSDGVVAADIGEPPAGGRPDPHMNARAQTSAPTASPPTGISQRRRRLAGRERAAMLRWCLLRGCPSSTPGSCGSGSSCWYSLRPASSWSGYSPWG
ncbi:hypothetical protein [Micromonospora sp. U21]|uniref:hypothetical protein n=1 Tax=Micromonospora sp. U21 TaxID=2824899 RepID=UPI001B381F65|nr:hypothetical protein [Micromonospora sp. U21]MBQ0906818.1 hypothetical protein [Micromonospora sp. U21]